MPWILTSHLIHITAENPRKSEFHGLLGGLTQCFGVTHVETEALRGTCSVGACLLLRPPCAPEPSPCACLSPGRDVLLQAQGISKRWEEYGCQAWAQGADAGGGRQGCQAACARGRGLPGTVLHLTHLPSQHMVSATLCPGQAA